MCSGRRRCTVLGVRFLVLICFLIVTEATNRWHRSTYGFEYILNARVVVFDYPQCTELPAPAGSPSPSPSSKPEVTCISQDDLFRNITLPSLLPVAFDYAQEIKGCIGCNIDAWLQEHAENPSFRYVVFLATGAYVLDHLHFKSSILSLMKTMDTEPAVLACHIMDKRAQTGDPSWLPYLHQQLFVLDKQRWMQQLGGVSFGTPHSHHFIFPSYQASSQTFHDRYTPYWLAPTDAPRLNSSIGTARLGTALMASSLEMNIRVINLPLNLRKSKGFTYPWQWKISEAMVMGNVSAALRQLATSGQSPSQLASTWVNAYSKMERHITVRSSTSDWVCFEISCQEQIPLGSGPPGMYVATNEPPPNACQHARRFQQKSPFQNSGGRRIDGRNQWVRFGGGRVSRVHRFHPGDPTVFDVLDR